MIDNSKQADGRRSGIALVIIIGFLAVLTVMAVGFAVVMRTERLVADSYAQSTVARNLARGALDYALASNRMWMAAEDLYYPDYSDINANFPNVLYSTGPDDIPGPEDMLEGAAGAYIPRALSNEVHDAVANTSGAGSFRWMRVLTNEFAGGEVDTYGEIYFMAVNCSGLLDVNAAFGWPDRGFGTNVKEFAFHSFPETGDAQSLQDNRNEFLGYDTPQEFIELGQLDAGAGRPLSARYLTGITTFSHYPPGYLDGNDDLKTDQVYLDWSVFFTGNGNGEEEEEDLAERRALINDVLTDAGLPGEGSVFWDNIKHYIDMDAADDPGLESMITPPVPLINEVRLHQTLVKSQVEQPPDSGNFVGRWRNRMRVFVEIWYPFVNYNAEDYEVEFTLRGAGGSPSDGLEIDEWSQTMAGNLSGPWEDGVRLRVEQSAQGQWESALLPWDDLALPESYEVEVELRRADDGEVVNRVRDLVFEQENLVADLSPGFDSGAYSFEVDDPRINWDGSNEDQWHGSDGGSMDRLNESVVSADISGADWWRMYVHNRGTLPSVGDLGFLLYDENRPWQTVDLLGDHAELLDRLVGNVQRVKMTGEILRPVKSLRGLFNPSSLELDVWRAVLEGMPMSPGGGVEITGSQIESAARAFAAAGPYRTLADLAEASDELANEGFSRWQQMVLIRNLINLLSCRQNLFTVFVGGRLVKPVPGEPEPLLMAERRGVAMVWRDPYGDEGSFVRFFKWLDD